MDFAQKMRRLTSTLRNWSNNKYGDIFVKVKQYEAVVRTAEEMSLQTNSKENREKLHAANAQYIRYLKLEYAVLQQKTQLHWLKEGDVNTKYFHAVMRGRRKKMYIHMDDSGE